MNTSKAWNSSTLMSLSNQTILYFLHSQVFINLPHPPLKTIMIFKQSCGVSLYQNLFSSPLYVCVCLSNQKNKKVFYSLRVGMAILPHPTLTAPPRPALQMWWGGDGAIFCPRPRGGGGGWVQYFYPQPAPTRPHPALIRTIIVNLVNLKSLIFKVKHKSTRYEIKYFLF